jgi:hypothetical protein
MMASTSFHLRPIVHIQRMGINLNILIKLVEIACHLYNSICLLLIPVINGL